MSNCYRFVVTAGEPRIKVFDSAGQFIGWHNDDDGTVEPPVTEADAAEMIRNAMKK